MRSHFVLLAGLLVLGTSSLMGQKPWENPGTTTPNPVCGPFQDQYDGTAWYCYYQGTFPWFDAGGGWTTMLRVAAPSSGAVHVIYDFFQLKDGSVDPVALNVLQNGTAVDPTSKHQFDLNPNQPSETTLLSAHTETGDVEASGSVHVTINCPDQATCAQIMPQLIYTYLPKNPWYLSGFLSSNVSLPTATTSPAWSAVGMNNLSDSSNLQFMTLAVFNDSGADQTYTVTAYDTAGKNVGQATTPTVTAGQSKGYVLHQFLTGLPNGLLKIKVTGTGTCLFTPLQFNGPAASALLPVAEVQ